MKKPILFLTVALGISAAPLFAQDNNPPPQGQRPPGREGAPGSGGDRRGPGGGMEGRRPMSPIVAALDLNGDGIIDAGEMAKAAESLKKLDKNGDGKLTQDEYQPPRPGGGEGRGPGGPGMRGPGDSGAGGPGAQNGRGGQNQERRGGGPGGPPGQNNSGNDTRPPRPEIEK